MALLLKNPHQQYRVDQRKLQEKLNHKTDLYRKDEEQKKMQKPAPAILNSINNSSPLCYLLDWLTHQSLKLKGY